MVFQDETMMLVEPIDSTKNSCSEPKISSSSPIQQCFHSSCSQCDVNYLKTIKSEIKQLTHETELFKYPSVDITNTSSYIPFENQRLRFYTIIDEWKTDRVEHIAFIYQKKKNQIDLICSQIFHEFEVFKIEQRNFLNKNLLHHNKTQNIHLTFISNEIEELNQKLSLTRHLLDYFIQPKLNNQSTFSDQDNNNNNDDDDDDEYVNYEQVFKQKPMYEYSLLTDNLAMACSNSHILLRDGAHLLLYNEKGKIHQLEIKVQHPGDFIRDICWCETLGYYLVLTQYLLFIYNPDKYSLTMIDKVKPIDRKKFSSITCSDNIMFLVNKNGECIERWSIAKSFNWKLIKRWSAEEFCGENFRLTARIRANHLMLAINICDLNFGYRICLYDYHMRLIRRINSDYNLHLLSYMNGNQWIATDYKERFYIFNDDDETIKTVIDYNGKDDLIRNICRLNSNYIAVKMKNRLQIYKINYD
ncbi:unnamed protein product [Adineta steineri]|uniref:Uncharacterized protein n=1 Tax=Adineta steineri TaxID=433720 RepID=A0A818NVP2_9BILA|nr:unnamed protein product [Adineta steineri]